METDNSRPDVGNSSSTDVGSMLFGMKSASFKNDLKALTKGELRKVIESLCFEGLEKNPVGSAEICLCPKLPEIISLGKSFVMARTVMALEGAMKEQQESAENTADNTAETSAPETEGNEVNG